MLHIEGASKTMAGDIKTNVDLGADFMVSCLEKGGKLHMSEKGMSCETPPSGPAKPASAQPSGPKR